MCQLQWVSTVSMLLITLSANIAAQPSQYFDSHLNHLETLPPSVPYGLPNHFEYAPAPAVEEALPWLPLPASSSLVPAPVPAQIPTWPSQTLPVVAPAPPAVAPATLLPAPIPNLPAIHQDLLPVSLSELHLPTVTQVLPPILEAVPFAPSYRVIPGPKSTTTKVAIGYAFPKLLPTPRAYLRALPLRFAHHHHHSLF